MSNAPPRARQGGVRGMRCAMAGKTRAAAFQPPPAISSCDHHLYPTFAYANAPLNPNGELPLYGNWPLSLLA